MKTAKKILIAACSAVAVCFLTAAGKNLNITSSAAEGANVSDYCVYGGAVKLVDERGAGVKFHVTMSLSYFANYGTIENDGKGTLNEDVKTGTLLLPYELTNGLHLTVGGSGYGATVSDSDTSKVWRKTMLDGTEYMQSVVYLYNIPSTDFGTEISVRGYIEKGGEYTYTQQENGISMSYVAKAEYEDENSALSAAEKASLKQTYLDKQLTFHVGEETTSETVDYLGLTSKCPTPPDTKDGAEFVGWITKDGEIVKNVTSTRVKNHMDLYAAYRQKVALSAASNSISLDCYDYDSVESIKFGNYDLGNDIAALTIPDALKNDTKNHGEQNVTATLVKGETKFTVNLPVLLITKEIANADDFKSIQPSSGVKGVYGYYVLTKDFSDNGLAGNAYADDWEETTGFFGTFDGQGHTISTAANGGSGIFGILRGATIKNVIIKDNWRSAYANYALLAKACLDSTLENVTFTLGAGNAQAAVGVGYGWLCYAEFSGNTLIDVTVNDTKGYGSLFGYKFANNVFDNVQINGTYTEMGHTADDKSVTYEEVTKITSKTLSGRQDFILDGGVSLLDLGDYNGLEILSVKTSKGVTLNGISSAMARNVLADQPQNHGEQDIIVTVAQADGTKVEITVPVTIITKVITTMSDLQASVKHTSGAENIYGYYVLGNDVSYTEDGFNAVPASTGSSSDNAFKGTLDGREKTITMKSSTAAYGLFGTINGATIKNVTIIDEENKFAGRPVIAYRAYNLIMENVTISITGGSATSASPVDGTVGKTPIFADTVSKSTFKNVTITSTIDIVNVFANQSNNDFSGGLDIIATVTGGFSITVTLDELPEGVTYVKKQ